MKLLLVLFGLLCLTSCGGSKTQLPVSGNQPPAQSITPASPATPQLFAVRMQPQEAVDPPDRSISWLDPQPLALLDAQLARVVSSEAELSLAAAKYEVDLPNNRVEAMDTEIAEFSPDWNPQLLGTKTELAYAMYRFNLSGALPLDNNTVSLGWDKLPAQPEHIYVGIANFSHGRWSWFQLHSDGVITFPGPQDFVRSDGTLLLTVLSIGDQTSRLSEIRLGDPEQRATGGLGTEHQLPDEPALFSEDLPDSVDLRPGCSPVGDQGQIGSCTAFAVGNGAYDYELNRIYEPYGWDFNIPLDLTSPRYLYEETGPPQHQDCPDDGRYLDAMISWLQNNGIASEYNAPYGWGSRWDWCSGRQWSDEAIVDAGLLNIETYYSFNPCGEAGLNSVKTILASQQTPVILQTALNEEFQLYESGVWQFSMPVIGYHAMLIVGYDDAMGALLVRNSWSGDWGMDGYIWIGYDTFVNSIPQQTLWCYTIEDVYDDSVADRFCIDKAAIGPPGNVAASDAQYRDAISVSWDKVLGADGYRVYRDSRSNMIGETTNSGWYDNTVTDKLAHTYWVSSFNSVTESPQSLGDTGYLATSPVLDGVSPVSGVPGQTVIFKASPQRDNQTLAWNFGGGAEPNESIEEEPQVVLQQEGLYKASVSIHNSVGTSTLYFDLTVTETGNEERFTIFGISPTSPVHAGNPTPFAAEYVGTFDGSATVLWEFGGGAVPSSSTILSPVVTPTAPGSYSASLTMDNAYGKEAVWEFELVVEASDTGDWSMFGRNAQGNSSSPFYGPRTNAVQWQYKTGMNIDSSPVIGPDGAIYIGSNDKFLYALNPDGSLRWKYAMDAAMNVAPAVADDGTVYARSSDLRLVALNADGSLKWFYDTLSPGIKSPIIGSDGTIYVLGWILQALNVEGTLDWSLPIAGQPTGSPAIASEGTIYVSTTDGKLFSISPEGDLNWNFLLLAGSKSAPAVGEDGTIYVGTNDNLLYAINPDKTVRWTFTTGNGIWSSPAIGQDGSIVFGCQDKKLYVLQPNGSLKWSYVISYDLINKPAIDAGGNIYVGTPAGNLIAMHPDGRLNWIFNSFYFSSASVAISADGHIYLGSGQSRIFSLGP